MKRASSGTRDSYFSNLARATAGSTPLDQSASSEVLGTVSTVLVIESDPIVRNLLRDILFRNGFMVLDAVSFSEGMQLLRMLHEERIDLLIIDRGADVLASLSASEVATVRPAAKVLFTFRPDGVPPEAEDSAVPGTAFLQHPFTEARLLEAVSGLIAPTTQ